MFKKALVAAAVIVAATGANAQSTATLSVQGVIAPTACALSLSNGGVIDTGPLPVNTVKAWTVAGTGATAAYVSPTNSAITLSVVCGSPTKVGLSFVDNRSSSGGANAFGLGMSGATALGNYQINYTGVNIKPTSTSTAAAPAARLVTSGVATPSSTWAAASGATATLINPGQSFGFSATASATTPDSLAEISGPLSINVRLTKSVVDAATSNLTLDGSGTITMVYL